MTKELTAETLMKCGMVTDAVWTDIDKDGWQDLVIVGDWMPVKLFRNEKGKKLTDISTQYGLEKSNGWWCKILPADIDGDGDLDLITGNMGTNSQFKVNEKEPLVTYIDDFNSDGKNDPILTWYIQGVSYPFNSRDELIEQMPVMNKRFLRYADYAKATVHDVLSSEQMEKAQKLYIYTTQTSLWINNKGKFERRALPIEAQFSMMNGILYKDYDGDGKNDILLTGNFYPYRVQQGRLDAGIGCLLKGDGKGGFVPVSRNITGLFIPGDVRDMLEIKGKNNSVIVISKNNDKVQVVKGK
jgi:hypothetical protein